MLVDLKEGSVDITVDFEAQVILAIEPGVWLVRHRGQEVSVTSLRGRLIGGHIYFAYPMGVARRANGAWARQERLLVGLLSEKPLVAWAELPDALRDALEDAYLLSRHDLPDQLGGGK